MAAVTVDRRRSWVAGNKRVVAAQVDIAANGDTWATGLTLIESVSATPNNAAGSQIGVTKSGGTVTFVTAGAESNVLVEAVGT